jgi:hypothetical protein
MMSLDADKLIFIDESGANLRMTNRYARAEGGSRIKMPVPCNHGPMNVDGRKIHINDVLPKRLILLRM